MGGADGYPITWVKLVILYGLRPTLCKCWWLLFEMLLSKGPRSKKCQELQNGALASALIPWAASMQGGWMGPTATSLVLTAQSPVLPLTWWVVLSRSRLLSCHLSTGKGRRNRVDMLSWEPIVDKIFPTLLLPGFVRGVVSWLGCWGALKRMFWEWKQTSEMRVDSIVLCAWWPWSCTSRQHWIEWLSPVTFNRLVMLKRMELKCSSAVDLGVEDWALD